MDSLTNNFTTYFLLLISITLLTVNCIDLATVIQTWSDSMYANRKLYDQCIKYPLISKTIFSIFSIFTSISITMLSMMFLVNLSFFINKLLKPFIKTVCFVFGPIMMGFTVLAFINWKEVVYFCDSYTFEKVLSISNVISILICFSISFITTIGFGIYEVLVFNIKSILGKDGGSDFVSKVFWGNISKRRKDEDNFVINQRQLKSQMVKNCNKPVENQGLIIEEEKEQEGERIDLGL